MKLPYGRATFRGDWFPKNGSLRIIYKWSDFLKTFEHNLYRARIQSQSLDLRLSKGFSVMYLSELSGYWLSFIYLKEALAWVGCI